MPSQTLYLHRYVIVHTNINITFSSNLDLKTLAPNSISSQGNTLKHLVLSKNHLSEVPTAAIKHLKNLEHLNLNENLITVLRNEAFSGLSKVSLDTTENETILVQMNIVRQLLMEYICYIGDICLLICSFLLCINLTFFAIYISM